MWAPVAVWQVRLRTAISVYFTFYFTAVAHCSSQTQFGSVQFICCSCSFSCISYHLSKLATTHAIASVWLGVVRGSNFFNPTQPNPSQSGNFWAANQPNPQPNRIPCNQQRTFGHEEDNLGTLFHRNIMTASKTPVNKQWQLLTITVSNIPLSVVV